MSAHGPQPTPQQLQPMMDAHMATWRWFTGTVAKSLIAILILLVVLDKALIH